MTPEQHKAFSEACSRFGDELAKILGTEMPTMDLQEPPTGWEILEFSPTPDGGKRGYQTSSLQGHGIYRSSVSATIPLNRMLFGEGSVESGHFQIHSVRRLSDNTVWTLGDKVANDTGGHGNITAFHISANNRIRVDADCFLLSRDLEQLRMPEKKPLFATADGVGISEGTVVWELYRNQVYPVIFTSDRKEASSLYSTQEAAEKAYNTWMESQPVLSFKDISKWDNSPDGWDKLREIVKQKIANR